MTRPKLGMLRFARPKLCMLRFCATQIRYVSTLRDPNLVCCDFARPKKGMLRPLQLKMGMLRFCATETFVRLCATQNRYVATSLVEFCDLWLDRLDQKMVSFDRHGPGAICFDRLDPSCLYFDHIRQRKNVSTEFDRWFFSTEQNFNREKTFRLCSTQRKRFDRVRPTRSFFNRKKKFDCVWCKIFSTEKSFDISTFNWEKKNLFLKCMSVLKNACI